MADRRRDPRVRSELIDGAVKQAEHVAELPGRGDRGELSVALCGSLRVA
jgi:hypothetical protein